MFRLLPATRAARGWLALTLSLALHAVFGLLLVLLSTRPGQGTAAATAPVLVLEMDEAVEQSDAPAARTTLAQNSAPSAPLQVAVNSSPENIVPVAATSTASAPTSANVVPCPHPGGGNTQRGASSGTRDDGVPSFFQVGTQAKRIVYVIDRSGSMGRNSLLGLAVRELLASLDHLPGTAQFQVVVYHKDAELLLPGPGELLAASAENKARVARALETLAAEGGTAHLPAVRLALTLGPQVIYLLTDADDLSHAERCEITRLNRGRVVIHTIELNTANRGRPEMPLQMLARENGGRYQAVEPR
jgi:hypothetical protein